MYRCVGCEGTVETLDSQCLCGKTYIDHKGRIKGENFMKIAGQKINERTKVGVCPHCGWKGLVIPRIDIGCPDHGIWYKSSGNVLNIEEGNNSNDRQLEGWDEVCGGRSGDHKKGKYDKNRQRLPRFGIR